MKFHLPTIIIFGPGKISELGRVVKEKLRASRPFLVTDKRLSRALSILSFRDLGIGGNAPIPATPAAGKLRLLIISGADTTLNMQFDDILVF